MATRNYVVGTAGARSADGVNYSDRAEAVLLSATHNQAAADVAEMIGVWLGIFCWLVTLEVITAEGGTLTIDVGDGGDVDCFLDGVNGNAAAVSPGFQTYVSGTGDVDAGFATKGVAATIGGRYYTGNDTIDMLFNDAADVAVLRLTAILWDVRGTRTFTNPVG